MNMLEQNITYFLYVSDTASASFYVLGPVIVSRAWKADDTAKLRDYVKTQGPARK